MRPKPRQIVIYCPDRHIVYDGRTPDRTGIGGGITARVRLAAVLARRGHAAMVVCNCRERCTHQGVRYRPLDEVSRLEADVLILNTTGGALDLSPALALEIDARFRMVWVGGIPEPKGIHEVAFDVLCAPSNFIRGVARDAWGIPPTRLAVFHNGVERRLFHRPWWRRRPRDPHRLVYCGHPDKGLRGAAGVFRLVRAEDPRLELHVYGGDGMYGGADSPPPAEAGVFYHGTLSQPRLYPELERGSVALHLQDTPEAFGISLAESMAAGCVVLASPVGALPETVKHGWNGLLVAGHQAEPSTWARAADLVLRLTRSPAWTNYLRANARHSPFDWDTIAEAWEGYWTWALDGKQTDGRRGVAESPACRECGHTLLALRDGYHCTGCGLYRQAL